MKFAVHIRPRRDILDPEGKAIAAALIRAGYQTVADVRVGKIVELEIADHSDRTAARADIDKMCQEFLVNPVMEDYRIVAG